MSATSHIRKAKRSAVILNYLFFFRKYGKSFYKCVVPIVGNVGDVNLGISTEDHDLLSSKVEVIFHVAANVKFNEPLQSMVKINIRGTKYVVELAKKCPNLKTFVHVSTAFSNCLVNTIEEKFYPPAMDPDVIIKIAEKGNPDELSLLTKK